MVALSVALASHVDVSCRRMNHVIIAGNQFVSFATAGLL
jgi:hypothetical protein